MVLQAFTPAGASLESTTHLVCVLGFLCCWAVRAALGGRPVTWAVRAALQYRYRGGGTGCACQRWTDESIQIPFKKTNKQN